MRLDGEIKEFEYEEERESVEEMNSVSNSINLGISQQVVVGYALTTKKKQSFLQPKFELIARDKGIIFVPIDQHRPLAEQGPFDIVLHKLLGNEWSQILENYALYIMNHHKIIMLDHSRVQTNEG